ncbi:MAG: hypothetical protein PHH28_16105 [Desulfuromonadaceae bacterium]|nr:hypothetical protein [Desulfuromonadaceae bacterium]
MKYLAKELTAKVEALSRDQNDFEKLISCFNTFKNNHPAIAGMTEAAFGITAIAIGAPLINPVDCEGKIPELIGAAFGTGVGGVVGGTFASIGGIGISMMGTAFAIPAVAVTAIGVGVGSLSGLFTGWFGIELASHTMSLLEIMRDNISGAALVAFGCYMLFLAIKDLWRAGGEFISYLRNLGINEIPVEELS